MSQDGLRHRMDVRLVFDDRNVDARGQHSPRQTPTREQNRVRFSLCIGLFAVAFVGLVGRLAIVSFGGQPEVRGYGVAAEQVTRPTVFDRNGRPLILNRDAIGFALNGKDIWDVEEAVQTVVGLYPETDANWLRTRLTDKKYAQISPSISPLQQQQAIATGLPGLVFPKTVERAYPQKDLAAHIVGYMVYGRGGVAGTELAIDDGTLKPAGEDITLSIDLIAQQVLEDELAAAVATFDAKAAWGVLLHAKTGEIRAMASLPDYNPNRPGGAVEGAWRNRAVADVYELGSAFKPITVALALDAEAVDVDDKFNVAKPLEIGGWQIHDYSVKTFPLSVSEVVQYSSNIGTVKIATALGDDRFLAGLKRMGLMGAVATELPERRAALLPKQWQPTEIATASYGHGIAVTPLQLTAAFASVVNGGLYVQPTIQKDQPPQRRRVLSASTSAQMRLILRKTVTEGTGRNAEAAGFYPIGKTATADKAAGGQYYDDGELISSFIGAFPGYDPEYVLLVSVDEPKSTKKTFGYATAGYVAAPVFQRVVERVAPPLGLMPVGDDVAFDGFVGMRREASSDGAATVLPVMMQGGN